MRLEIDSSAVERVLRAEPCLSWRVICRCDTIHAWVLTEDAVYRLWTLRFAVSIAPSPTGGMHCYAHFCCVNCDAEIHPGVRASSQVLPTKDAVRE